VEPKAMQPKTLQEAIKHFSDEQECIDAVAAMRWPEGVRCPDCDSNFLGEKAANPYYLKTQKRWKCRNCRRQFSVKVGTIFEDSPIPLQKWLPALWMLVSCKNGISSYELHRDLGVTQKTAWFMLHRLRLALFQGIHKVGGDGSEVEVDETYVGGKMRNMHAKRRKAIRHVHGGGIHVANKTPVVGMLDSTAGQVEFVKARTEWNLRRGRAVSSVPLRG
jgi:transposase-like protein